MILYNLLFIKVHKTEYKMKINIIALTVAFFSVVFVACDDTTDTLGTSLTDNMDMLEVSTDTFEVVSCSFVADSVLSRNTVGYLGKIRDPETGNYIAGDFMAQFGTLENYNLPVKDSIVSVDETGNVVADSCNIRLFYTTYYGDSLATMNITAHEMAKPMKEDVKYYSNFNPMQEGFVRQDGMKVNKTYTLSDLSIDESERADEGSYTPNIKISLNKEYIDKDGVKYNNFGTYIMRQYYKNPENFKNSYNFIHNVCPGFFFEVNDGLGSMAYISVSQLNVYFRYKNDSTYVGTSSFAGTEEVLQTTNIINDNGAIKELASDNSCTYLKTPSGIFTEVTLPIDEVKRGHENDTLNTAELTFTRINNNYHGEYALDAPSMLLMIPKDSLYSFFENSDIIDYQKSYVASYDSNYNKYVFNNISSLITFMYNLKEAGIAADPNWLNDKKNENWNKVVIVPVTVETNSSSQIVKVVHDMSLTSTKLVGGSDNHNGPILLNVVYSKFNHK